MLAISRPNTASRTLSIKIKIYENECVCYAWLRPTDSWPRRAPGPGRLALSKRRQTSRPAVWSSVHHDDTMDGHSRTGTSPLHAHQRTKAARARRVASKIQTCGWPTVRLPVPVEPARILVRTTAARSDQKNARLWRLARPVRGRLADERHRPFRRLMGRLWIACVYLLDHAKHV
jgi:hypothetical protein